MTSKKDAGPAAFLLLFAKGDCKKLRHKSCGARLCPCNDAREWLSGLPKRMAFASIWGTCDRNDWLLWLARAFGLSGGTTPDETRQLIPWENMAHALENPPQKTKCEHCEEIFHPDELYYGYCEDCEGEYVHCIECDTLHWRDDNHPCAHLRWSDSVGEFVGTGTDIESMSLPESFEALLIKLGLVLTRKLRDELEHGKFGKRPICYEFGDCGQRFDELLDSNREIDNSPFEEALFWLDTLHPHQTKMVAMVKAWVHEHIARREKAIAADKSPRRILIDGNGRVYVKGGSWSAIRAQGTRMSRRRAKKMRRRVESVFVGVALRVVHVLKPAPAWKGTKR